MNKINYNPDVLTCLANLSNDEVFTPPQLVNEMLDMLPKELWSSKEAKFLDPFSKTGVFLREITARLVKGLEKEMPDLQTRVDHILKNQIYGIAITELTSFLSRRGLYCSKIANGKYSICNSLSNESGNIIFKNIEHTWKAGSCIFCGASKEVYDRNKELETYAYNFIHTNKPEEVFNMKFDVIIGNPPYQLNTGGTQSQAIPLYHKFVQQAKKLNPRFLVMIIPSRWFAGGMGLDQFRSEMLSDSHILKIVDYTNAKECFPGISLGGGVHYFLRDSLKKGLCEFTNIHNNKSSTALRKLDQFPIFVRFNEALEIINKVVSKKEKSLSEIVSPLSPFGIPSSERGDLINSGDKLTLISSDGPSFLSRDKVLQGKKWINKYKVMVSKVTSEHASESDKEGKYKVFSTLKLLGPEEVCTFSYFVIGDFDNKNQAINLEEYLKTKFVRFLLLQSVSSINLSREKFNFIPMQDFTESWDDNKLYSKYQLSNDEIGCIESMIKPMGGNKNGK